MNYKEIVKSEPSLTGLYSLDELSGTVCTDSSSSPINGTYIGTPALGYRSMVFGDESTCVDFDGSNDGVALGDSYNIGTGDFTIEALFEYTNNTTSRQKIFSKNRNTSIDGQYHLVIEYGGALKFHVDSITGSNINISTSSLTPGKIYHVIATLDRNGSAVIYLNGVNAGAQGATSFTSDDLQCTTNASIGMGYESNNSGRRDYMDGRIQYVAIYNSMFRLSKVTRHYQATLSSGLNRAIIDLGPTAYFPMYETSGKARDWSTYRNDGTISGDVTRADSGLASYGNATSYGFGGVDAQITISPPASTTTYSLIALIKINSATGEFKILEDNGVGHWSIKDGKQNLRYSASDHLSDTAISTVDAHLVGVSVSAGAVTFYLDGEADGTDVSAIALNFETISDALAAFNGNMQCVGIDNQAWTASQHRTIYHNAVSLVDEDGFPGYIKSLTPSAYLRLGERRGTIAIDETTNNKDGVIVGTPVLGDVDSGVNQGGLKALTLSGTEGVDLSGVNFTGSTITLIALVKSSQSTINSYIYDSGNTSRFVFAWNGATTGTLAVYSGAAWSDFGLAPNDDLWHVVSLVCSGTSATCYVDGVQSGSVATITAVDLSANAESAIGSSYEGTSSHFIGGISDFIVLESAVTALQQSNIYQGSLSYFSNKIFEKGPSNYFRMNELSGNAIDIGSLGNDGVWTGTPTYNQASEFITNNANNKSISVTGSESVAFTSITTSTTYTLLAIIKPTTVSGSQEIFSDGTNSLRLNNDRLSFYYSAAEHNSDTTIVAGNSYLVGISVNAGSVAFYVNGVYDGGATASPTFTPTKLLNLTFSGVVDEMVVFDTTTSQQEMFDIWLGSFYTAPADPFTLFGVTGQLTESLTMDKWIVRSFKRDDGLFLDSQSWDGVAPYVCLTDGFEGSVDIMLLPDIGVQWEAGVVKAIGARVYPSDAINNSEYFECTTAGTTGVLEPSWGSSTVNDNGVVWTLKGDLVRPLVHGPLKPTLVA